MFNDKMNMLLNSEEGKQSNMQIKKKRRLHNNLKGGGLIVACKGIKDSSQIQIIYIVLKSTHRISTGIILLREGRVNIHKREKFPNFWLIPGLYLICIIYFDGV